MLRDVGAAEAVDRVVGDEPVGDEVVRVLDIEVVDRAIERDALDRLDDVVAAIFCEHHHAGPYRRRGHEGQRVASRQASARPSRADVAARGASGLVRSSPRQRRRRGAHVTVARTADFLRDWRSPHRDGEHKARAPCTARRTAVIGRADRCAAVPTAESRRSACARASRRSRARPRADADAVGPSDEKASVTRAGRMSPLP